MFSTRSRVVSALVAGVSVLALAGCASAAVDSPAASAGPVDTSKGTLITYNSPSSFANFQALLDQFGRENSVAAPSDSKNSGQALAALTAEAAAPQADAVYLGVAFGPKAVAAGVLDSYEPEGFDAIPDGLKDPDGKWFAVHTGAIAFICNTEAIGKLDCPKSWADLLKPEYAGMVGYLDPSQAAVGYSVAAAANLALGGSITNWAPGLDYLTKLKANGAVTPAQTATAKVVQGEIPILIDADFNGYAAKYNENAPLEVTIPTEGSLQIPYVAGLVKNAPHPELAKKWLDYLLSDDGQATLAAGYVRPISGKVPADLADKVESDEEFSRAVTVDYAALAAAQADFTTAYQAQVR
ncbi:extracellular solute-binding protein [Agreia sp. COWG]|uniref:extracellular solute-binding protein n=1 Tax=Agreia sp. COWG TaxID=2773266 RepID=UPI001927CADF|nr:extracellular solute-binding protein [Agreia sp. COWG]CAD6008411.1 ABC transporter substrate-binding protein [Agreia sp. COWG]